ncbi:hypothetical protein B0A55_08158 [Friedmanniomyces simplex]|uniref:Uncharacterized protein n=1 Tax=Friedmanniomyces simplex TaxID=329884 RepID=A0A4U0X2Z1_9PEZI|nr:hypothetical protein B0A55_08158 [Friedmanniomyces simplex]
MAAARLRTPTLAFAALSICLNLAIIGCAGRTLSVFNTQQSSNVWLLPLWPNHFDTRELHALAGTATAIVVLNAVLILSLFVHALPANLLILASSLLSTVCSLTAVIFPTLLNQHAPGRDTLQTWTCRWNRTTLDRGRGPSGFRTLCHETRFATYTTIPVLLLQLLLLGMAAHTLLTIGGRGARNHPPQRLASDTEKSTSQHELGRVRGQSFDTTGKSESSPRSQQEALMEGAGKGVQFA